MNKSRLDDESRFNDFMESIDKEMQRDGIPIHARGFHGVTRTGTKLNIRVTIAPPDQLSSRIFLWFEKRYGDRLKIDMRPGSIALILQGDAYCLKLPLLVGNFIFLALTEPYCKAPQPLKDYSRKKTTHEPTTFNPLYAIEGMTVSLALRLSANELRDIEALTHFGYCCYDSIRNIRGHKLIESARGDITDSVNKIFSIPAQYGQSKWASLQACEKFLKAYIIACNDKPKKTHNLYDLLCHAKNLGLPSAVSSDYIDKVQVNAEARYGELDISIKQAVEAHHACLSLCAQIATLLNIMKP